MHSIIEWNLARSPNYTTNEDLIYHYSEVPFIGNYKLVKLPLPEQDYLEHVDYWGEGRIIEKLGASGFANCYNVNHQYQLVSNGPDRNRKIPNRIPVISYTNCDTSSYIRDNSVMLVTLMGAPINKSCAEDITRMVNDTIGKVVVYGFDENTADIRNLERELQGKGIYFCPSYKLSAKLNSLTLFDSHRVYINKTELTDLLYKSVVNGKYEDAVGMSKSLSKGENSDVCENIVKTVEKLLKERHHNLINYAYKLWNSDGKDIITNNFPIPFKQLFDESSVKIMNKKYMIALKLDVKGSDEVKGADFDNKDNKTDRWKLIPVWNKEKVYFIINNFGHETFLKLEDSKDSGIQKQVIGVKDIKEAVQWSIQPMKIDDDILFFITNQESNEGLKFVKATESSNDKVVLDRNESENYYIENFGWFIIP